ncbi:MAG: ANTAR domain-containing protein [Lachnospiraceae bacterium]|nr:ANTAR domain-containing protein [Lachnospiraceae bacterium]
MPKHDDTVHSALIVSASEQFESLIKRSLMDVITVESRKSGAMARRYVLERYYDLVIINAPLPDESGEELALDIVEQCDASVLMVVPQDIFEDVLDRVTEQGIMVMPKPSPKGRIDKSVRFLVATQNKMHRLEAKVARAEEKLEEMRVVNKAKLLLINKKKMSEDEAHRYIGKMAMDNGISRGRAAERILDDL